MKIKFLKDRAVEAQGVIVQTFKAGEVYELSASSAKRWIRRNLATEVIGKAVPKRKPASKPAVKKAAPQSTTLEREPPITSTDSEDAPE